MEQLTHQLKGKAPIIPITELGGPAPTGFPSPALDYMEDEISLDETFIKNRHATFLMIVSGDSMSGAGILPGAILIVDRSLIPNNMDIVVAIVDADLTFRHFKREDDKGWLIPANDKYPVIEVNADIRFEVWGVVIHWVNSSRPTSFITLGKK